MLVNDQSPHLPGSSSESTEHPLIRALRDLVPALARIIPPPSEVAIHDLAKFPQTRVEGVGEISTGDLTDAQLRALLISPADRPVDSEHDDADGRRIRSSSQVLTDSSGARIAVVRFSTDLSFWLNTKRVVDAMVGLTQSTSSHAESDMVVTSMVPHGGLAELASQLIDQAIADVGLPVSEMKKPHKSRVVEELQNLGVFMLRDSVETVAAALDVTRFTIYNYLNELELNGEDRLKRLKDA